MTDWLGEGGVAVPVEIADGRAEKCLNCSEHRRVRWWEIAQEHIAKHITEQLVVKNQMGVRLSREPEMGVCRACGCVLALKAHVPLKHILAHTDAETMNRFVPKCWIKTEQTT